MILPIRRALAAGAVVLAMTAGQASAQEPNTSIAQSARVIVKFRSDSTASEDGVLSAVQLATKRAEVVGHRLGLKVSTGRTLSGKTQVLFAEGISSAELARQLALDADVEYAVPDERRHHLAAPNDPLYGDGQTGSEPSVGQWYLRAPAGDIQSSINVEPAWNVTLGSPTIVVADLDTGVRFDHPDLQPVSAGGNLLAGYDMVTNTFISNDGDGRDADASDPGDFVTQAESFSGCPAKNSSWHGTQTAGLIAALTNNGIGMASVGRNVRLLPVRVLGKCGGFDSDIIAGMLWAAGIPVQGIPTNTTPAKVMNMSFGGDTPCNAAYEDAITQITAAGATMVAAAGNSAGHTAGSPAVCTGVIAVGGLRHVGTKVGFSDVGPEIAISAPGGNCVNTDPGSPCLYPILTTSNSGTTSPAAPIYTDSFNISAGTSFSAPLVTGTVGLMLSANPKLSPAQVRSLLQSTARPFPTTSTDGGADIPQCMIPQFFPIDQLECVCTINTCGAGMLDAGAAVVAAAASAAPNYQGLWFVPAESGWGINFAHQGDLIFASWFTFDLSGKGTWLVATIAKTTGASYTGQLFQGTGPAFDAVPFPPLGSPGGAVVGGLGGTATVNFIDANNATFTYTVAGITQTKNITRQLFGPQPVCMFGAQSNLALATNYTDLWWASPPGSEAGWGINLTHQGDTIFASWFTYDHDHTPMWLVVTASKTAANTYVGTQLFKLVGPAFNAVPFPPLGAPGGPTGTSVGDATFVFQDGNRASFTYTINGTTQTKTITREIFTGPGTVCN